MTETKIPDAKDALIQSLQSQNSINHPQNVLFEDCKKKILKSISNGDKYEFCNRNMGENNMKKLLNQGYGIFDLYDSFDDRIEVHWFENGSPSFCQPPPSVPSKQVVSKEHSSSNFWKLFGYY